MIKVTDTLSSMVMAAPLTVAASAALSHDNGVQRFEMHDSTKLVASGMQWDRNQQWHIPDRVKASGNQAQSSSEWYGTQHRSSDRFQGSADFGATPLIRTPYDSPAAWYVEEGEVAHQLTGPYGAGWRRRSAAYGDEDYMEARYITRSGVDIELLQDGSAAGCKYPDNTVSFVASSVHEAAWTWTQTA